VVWAIRDSQGAAATEQRATCASVTKFALNYCTAETDGPQGEVRIFLPKEKSEQARKGRRDLILPILKLKTQKVSRNFLGKEKPTLKQIRQQKLSYLQSSSRFDVVGNKGLARSGSDGAASNVCERHKIRPQLLYCRDGRATRRSSDFLSKEKSEQAKRRRPDNGGQ